MKLQIEQLSIAFSDQQVLKEFSMSIDEGEFVAIIGTSGCGKSTLLNVLAGSLSAQSGSIRVDQQEINGVSSHFAYMPQNDLLLPWATILDNVCLYGALKHQKKAAKEQALKAWKRFGLDGYESAYPHELSGGMRQRAAFLRTALCDADILLLDEPFGALDVITRNEMQDWLLQLRNDLHKTILLVTHDIEEALYLADRILILGNRPASIIRQIDLREVTKSRDWLFEQAKLKRDIHRLLQETHNDA